TWRSSPGNRGLLAPGTDGRGSDGLLARTGVARLPAQFHHGNAQSGARLLHVQDGGQARNGVGGSDDPTLFRRSGGMWCGSRSALGGTNCLTVGQTFLSAIAAVDRNVCPTFLQRVSASEASSGVGRQLAGGLVVFCSPDADQPSEVADKDAGAIVGEDGTHR